MERNKGREEYIFHNLLFEKELQNSPSFCHFGIHGKKLKKRHGSTPDNTETLRKRLAKEALRKAHCATFFLL